MDETVGIDELMTQLRQSVERLEKPGLTIEDALAEYEKGVDLARQAQAALESAERRVVEIINTDGTITPFTSTRRGG